MTNNDQPGHYDIDLACSGDGWRGTFGVTVRTAAEDILSDGQPWGPVAVTVEGATAGTDTTITGTLTAVEFADTLIVHSDDGAAVHRIPIDDILRFRA